MDINDSPVLKNIMKKTWFDKFI